MIAFDRESELFARAKVARLEKRADWKAHSSAGDPLPPTPQRTADL